MTEKRSADGQFNPGIPKIPETKEPREMLYRQIDFLGDLLYDLEQLKSDADEETVFAILDTYERALEQTGVSEKFYTNINIFIDSLRKKNREVRSFRALDGSSRDEELRKKVKISPSHVQEIVYDPFSAMVVVDADYFEKAQSRQGLLGFHRSGNFFGVIKGERKKDGKKKDDVFAFLLEMGGMPSPKARDIKKEDIKDALRHERIHNLLDQIPQYVSFPILKNLQDRVRFYLSAVDTSKMTQDTWATERVQETRKLLLSTNARYFFKNLQNEMLASIGDWGNRAGVILSKLNTLPPEAVFSFVCHIFSTAGNEAARLVDGLDSFSQSNDETIRTYAMNAKEEFTKAFTTSTKAMISAVATARTRGDKKLFAHIRAAFAILHPHQYRLIGEYVHQAQKDDKIPDQQ